MTAEEILDAATAKVLTLLPGDLLVLNYDGEITPSAAERVRETVQPKLPEGVELLLIGKGIAVQAFRGLK